MLVYIKFGDRSQIYQTIKLKSPPTVLYTYMVYKLAMYGMIVYFVWGQIFMDFVRFLIHDNLCKVLAIYMMLNFVVSGF